MKKCLSVLFALILSVALSACTETAGGPIRSIDANIPKTVYETNADIPAESAADTTVIANTSSYLISRQHAIKLSLEAAQLSRIAVRDIDAEIERDMSTTFWEVDFETKDFEYSFLINAFDGTIVRNNLDIND